MRATKASSSALAVGAGAAGAGAGAASCAKGEEAAPARSPSAIRACFKVMGRSCWGARLHRIVGEGKPAAKECPAGSPSGRGQPRSPRLRPPATRRLSAGRGEPKPSDWGTRPPLPFDPAPLPPPFLEPPAPLREVGALLSGSQPLPGRRSRRRTHRASGGARNLRRTRPHALRGRPRSSCSGRIRIRLPATPMVSAFRCAGTGPCRARCATSTANWPRTFRVSPLPNHGNLESWARQGMLLLNTVLTVRPHEPQSHRGRGWETFTDRIIAHLNRKSERVVFLLWGNSAHKKRSLITGPHTTRSWPAPILRRSPRGSFSAVGAFPPSTGTWRSRGQPPITLAAARLKRS
jgi:hypothetical protein